MRTTSTLALIAALLAGCSAPPAESTPEVASVRAPASAPAGTVAQKAPVIRPDTTWAEEQRMRQPWMRCLKENGIPMLTTEDGLLDIDASGNTKATNGRVMAAQPAVEKVCGMLRPVLAPELDEARNPYWADDDENYHLCLVEAGYDFVKKNGEWRPGPSWYTDDTPPNEAVELGCQAKAFDGKKG